MAQKCPLFVNEVCERHPTDILSVFLMRENLRELMKLKTQNPSLIEGSTFKGAEWNLVSHKFCLFPSSSCKYQNKEIRAKIVFFGIVSWIQSDNSDCRNWKTSGKSLNARTGSSMFFVCIFFFLFFSFFSQKSRNLILIEKHVQICTQKSA